jgi:DNA-binding IclR family transcriptional regulator
MSSLETAVNILRCFSAEMPELAVGDVAKRIGAPKSTISRLLRTMAACGLVEQSQETRRYRVGQLPFHLGQLYQSHVEVLEMVETEVARLVEETGFTGYIGVLNGTDIVLLRRRHGRYPVRMVLEPSYRVAAFTTAIGKALLARHSNDELRRMLPATLVHEPMGLRRPTARFLTEMDGVRQRMWANASQETFPGMGAIGTAVGSADGQQPVGLSLSFPVNAAPPAVQARMVDRLVAVTRRIAERTGDPVWAAHVSDRPAAAARARAAATRRAHG